MKILVAEDEEAILKLLNAVLGNWGYEVVGVQDGIEALRTLRESKSPMLVLLDWMLPGMEGPDICRAVRKLDGLPYTYIILLTGRAGRADLITGMEAGADDYITKPLDLAVLKVRLRAGRRILALQENLLRVQEMLKLEASTDALTGARSRREILRILDAEMGRSVRLGCPLSVAMLDLDQFKKVNDRFGHAAGDLVVQEAVRLVRESVRPYDEIGRLGGDEFLLVLPQCDREEAARIGERIRESIAGRCMSTSQGLVRISVSLGVAALEPPESPDAMELVKAADRALYRAKKGGRNRVCKASETGAVRAGEPRARTFVLRVAPDGRREDETGESSAGPSAPERKAV